MHKIITGFFIFLYMVAMLRPIQPYVEYFLNQDYIAEFLCINKDKPELECNGNCYLIKEVEKQQENQPFASLKVSLENYPIGFVNILQIKPVERFVSSTKNNVLLYKNLYRFNYQYSEFHPPDFV